MLGRTDRLLLAAAALAAGCASARFEAWPVEPRNPTRWTFDIGKDDARTLILDAFCPEEMQMWTVLKEPAEGDDIKLYAGTGWVDLVFSQYLSPVYHNARGPCPMMTRFRLHLTTPSPGRTTVEVIPEGMRVVAGRTSGFLRVHGPANIVKPAAPTTVEEYTILRRCGEAFGVRDMPETTIPPQGTDAIAGRLVADEPRAEDTLLFLGGPAVTTSLVATLNRDGEGARKAAYLLGCLHATAALPALGRALQSPHWDVREAAGNAIGAMRPRKEPSVDDLVTQLMSRAATDRLDAAIALVSTGRELDRARPVLDPFLESDIRSERWRAKAALVRLRRLPGTP